MNDILSMNEKFGGRFRSQNSLRNFQDFVFDNRLMDLGFKGSLYTWTNNQQGSDLIMERLDRGLCNVCWRELHQKAIVKHMEFIGSDHYPLLVCLNPCDKRTPWVFKFESMWVGHERYKDVVKDNWGWSPVLI